MNITPLTPIIGAEIGGIDLGKPLNDETISVVRAALVEWKVIFFRDQDITTSEHIAFARRFGDLEIHPFAPKKEGHPEVLELENGPNNKSRINVWHSDVTWRFEPSLGSILRAVEVPEVGGDTMWANMEAAYDGLDDALKEKIEGRIASHDFMATFGRPLSDEKRAEMRERYPIAHHPVVRTHPESGRRSIYVNAAFTSGIDDMDPDESHEILQRLYFQSRIPEYQVRFQWRCNSIAFWDNRGAQHYPVSDYFPAVRRMERVTVVGDRPA